MAYNKALENQIVALLHSNPKAVERAMVVLWDRQTADEKAAETTRHHNQRGFSGSTDKRGSYFAKWVLSGRHLTGIHLVRARTIAIKHRRQLVEEATNKASKKASQVHVEAPNGTFVQTSEATFLRK